jgi:hypothetical protein
VFVFLFVVAVITASGGGIGRVSLRFVNSDFRNRRSLFLVVFGNAAAANVAVYCHVFPPGCLSDPKIGGYTVMTRKDFFSKQPKSSSFFLGTLQ